MTGHQIRKDIFYMISKPYSTDFTLEGKTAVITGAASGIGYATAKLFAEKGARVCLLDRNLDAARQAGNDIPGSHAYFVDVSDYSGVNETVDRITREVAPIDVLVHCAGIGDIEWAKDFDEKTWNKVINVNLSGSFYMAQAVGKKMIEAGNGGKIICMASQAGIVAIDKHVAYSASKAAIISIVKSLAYEWGQYGIQVNAISPTATETPIIVGYWDVGEVHKKAIEGTPAGRFCKPEEIAAAAFFLATEASNMITGSNLVVDGGYTIH